MPDGVTPPLTELRLTNFKSVAKARVPLSHLTLIVGANSSGKSNLLRALLALAQTIGSATRPSGVLLNGERINLGAFTDVLRQDCESDQAEVGVTAMLDAQRGYASPGDLEVWQMLGPAEIPFDFDVSFSGVDIEDPIFSPAQTIRLKISPPLEEIPATEVILKRESKPQAPLGETSVLWTDLFGHRATSIDTQFKGSVKSGADKFSLSGVELRGLLPWQLVQTRPSQEELPEAWVRTIAQIERFGILDARVGSKTTFEGLVGLGVETLREWDAEGSKAEEADFRTFILDKYSESPLHGQKVLTLIGKHAELAQRISESLSLRGKIPVGVSGKTASVIRIASAAFRNLCADKTWHLAGLREAPLPLYPASARVQDGEIGDKGEYVAAALHGLRDRIIDTPLENSEETQRMTLREAVAYWVERLELLSAIEPHHRGTLGLDIAVMQPGLQQPLDITSVGLGVSQLLPVVVRCLLARTGDVILLEQPELHLHPASQQRLADFLLSCARSGRQLIVETHSEHIINRLRLRAAEDDSEEGAVARTISVICAERDAETGISSYREAVLNAFGGFDEWPSGFFDPGISEAQQILRTGLEKMRKQRDAAS